MGKITGIIEMRPKNGGDTELFYLFNIKADAPEEEIRAYLEKYYMLDLDEWVEVERSSL